MPVQGLKEGTRVIVLDGETPSKKNSRINTRSGRSFPNRRYTAWHDLVVAQIKKGVLEGKYEPFGPCVSVELTVTFYHGDLHRRDSDNQVTSILDTLVDAGILWDDCWRVVPIKHVFDSYDRGNPRCVVSVDRLLENY